MISDRDGSIVVESVKDGMKIYDNLVGVMSNSPGFGFNLLNLANCMSLSRSDPEKPPCRRLGPYPLQPWHRRRSLTSRTQQHVNMYPTQLLAARYTLDAGTAPASVFPLVCEKVCLPADFSAS